MTVFTPEYKAAERPQFSFQAAGDQHEPPPQPSASASTSSGSLSAQDREQTSNVANSKGFGSMKKRLIRRLTFSESQSAKDAMLAQPGMRVALDGLCYTVRGAHAYEFTVLELALVAGAPCPLHTRLTCHKWLMTGLNPCQVHMHAIKSRPDT